MLAVQRRHALIDILEHNPILTVDSLAQHFGVSTQTVRRDLVYLEERGLLRRTYGGAVATGEDRLNQESVFRAREEEHAAQKRAIGIAALSLVEPGSTVMFDASTTVLQLASALPLDIELTAIVNALPVAGELARRTQVNTTVVGGSLRHASLSFVGPDAEDRLRRLFADTAFISTSGLALGRGLMESNAYQAAIKALMIANAGRVVGLIDSSKVGRSGSHLFASVGDLHTLVTDDGIDPALLVSLRALGLDVVVAPPIPSTVRRVPRGLLTAVEALEIG